MVIVMQIHVTNPIKYELISRVVLTRKDAEEILSNYNVDSSFKPYCKMNNSKTGWYVCYLASWNEYRIKEWHQWLKERGVKCYLVKA